MARQTLGSIYRRDMVGKIQRSLFFDTIRKTQNASTQDFLMEDLCLDVIAR
jgi:predicted RNA-binding protein associated with RNAse of E/G family